MKVTIRCMRIIACLIFLAILSACAEAELASHTAKQTQPTQQKSVSYKIGKPYQVSGVRYEPKEDFSYDETGIASWYGPKFHGKKTASGEIFDQYDITAAHPTLPMPTIARVTNLDNGRSIKVRINDRGPFVHGRIIDLSMKSAELLGFKNKGTAKVRVQVLENETKIYAGMLPGEALDAPIVAKVDQGKVEVAKLETSADKAINDANAVVQQGSVTAAAAKDGVDIVPVQPSSMYVQAGAFTDYTNATRLAQRLSHIGAAKVQPAVVNGTQFYRVRFGPMQEVNEADLVLAQLLNNGIPSAKVVID